MNRPICGTHDQHSAVPEVKADTWCRCVVFRHVPIAGTDHCVQTVCDYGDYLHVLQLFAEMIRIVREISGFHNDTVEAFALLGC